MSDRSLWAQRARDVLRADRQDFAHLFKISGLDPKTDLRLADWSGVSFAGCDLRGFDFTGARLHGCTFDGALIAGARFDQAEIDRAARGDMRDSHPVTWDSSLVTFDSTLVTADSALVTADNARLIGSLQPARRTRLRSAAAIP